MTHVGLPPHSVIRSFIHVAPVRKAGLYEQLCIISYLSSRIFCYLWKSHALLDSLIRSNYSATLLHPSSLQSSSLTHHFLFKSQICFPRSFLRVATENGTSFSFYVPDILTYVTTSQPPTHQHISFVQDCFLFPCSFVIPPLHALQHLTPPSFPIITITITTVDVYPL